MKGFIEFIQEHKIVGLAIGFIFAGAIAKLVSAFVKDIVDPILGVALGARRGLGKFVIPIGSAKINVGHFASSLIDFIIIVIIVYILLKALKIEKFMKKKEGQP
jgi:large conductance mechanosensitive channel